jgi:hypothetical protein
MKTNNPDYNPNYTIQKKMDAMSDQELVKIVSDYKHLGNHGVHPEKSKFQELTTFVCEIYNVPFNLKMAEDWLQKTVFDRYNTLIMNKEDPREDN